MRLSSRRSGPKGTRRLRRKGVRSSELRRTTIGGRVRGMRKLLRHKGLGAACTPSAASARRRRDGGWRIATPNLLCHNTSGWPGAEDMPR